ncbi:acyl-CoA dehydratase activase-related protein [Clostridium tetani]|uniref:2-hydroxyglutaryl-CoA dehydratase n=1 Tax=Clostridium tetani TaxID=1513 RepID=A0ABY0ER54_CLOTA|nr:acyl-CoA dehydratase activase-related protein [Clostridium tetani]CDI48514.1 activator of (R)-2-hydroxyglutaryl-CoAdehydratase [Clostridium tetani 12124569]KHO40129.1 2-hydroxyglutaryl-CoA dehydratase [Clostridium tetani]RXI40905.1 2-hydroxyglutaryl-CoA dehydratase [Clostridium tetani]RXI57592.1 2-hydroxyglutaryl-CoA dehydratase [Clostridium tetani]RXI72311.1 2-hydroxyglutaryl-CoA dehydratase [Clostridium tetani]
MRIGIPKGLLYYKYYPFYMNFFKNLGFEVITSPDTNEKILNDGIKTCVDESCLPVKVFHGHCSYLKDKCDLLFVPRIMQINKDEYICPKFCGLVEMVANSIDDIPPIISEPIYAYGEKELKKWAIKTGNILGINRMVTNNAFKKALKAQKHYMAGINNENFSRKIALIGHPYNIFDNYINMNITEKLNKLGIGVITEEYLGQNHINKEVKRLYKKPFWTFVRNSYGFASYMTKNKMIDGIVYISSFGCGVDSVILELIKNEDEEVPILEIKLDEQRGEAGIDTRLEAFSDMLQIS